MKEEKSDRLVVSELHVENFRNIHLLQVFPREGTNCIEVSGFNTDGKTSACAAIFAATAGAGGRPVKPLRDGARKGKVKVGLAQKKTMTINDLVVEWTFTSNSDSLRVWGKPDYAIDAEAVDGEPDEETGLVRLKSPQAVLDRLQQLLNGGSKGEQLDRYARDPMELARESKYNPKKVRDLLLKIAPIGIDLDAIDAEREEEYEARKKIGQRKRELEGQVAGLPKPGEYVEEPDTKGLLARKEELGAVIRIEEDADRAALDAQSAVDECKSDLTNKEDEVKAAELEIRRITKLLETAQAALVKHRSAVVDIKKAGKEAVLERDKATDRLRGATEKALEARAELKTVDADLAAAAETSKKAADSELARRRRKELKEAARSYTDHTRRIEELDARKEDGLARAELPMPGMSFDDEHGVTLNGRPLWDCSAMERILAGVTTLVAANPAFGVFKIEDGSLLDSRTRAQLDELCGDRVLQAWVELVDESGKIGIVMHEGSVVHDEHGLTADPEEADGDE